MEKAQEIMQKNIAPKPDPIRPADEEARRMARSLLNTARFGALGVIDPETGAPVVSRVAIGTTPEGAPLTLISSLSQHTAALRSNPACSVLLGEPGERGDPLTHPRLTLQCHARFVDGVAPQRPALREGWLTDHPKAKLYIDFADFGFVVFEVGAGFLNGGFGKAYALVPADLGLSVS